jgi:hypothetical protein
MATELERIEALERKVASLEERLGIVDTDVQAIADLIKTEFRLVESRLLRTQQGFRDQFDDFLADIDRRLQDFRTHVDQRFDATLRAIAEMLKEGR